MGEFKGEKRGKCIGVRRETHLGCALDVLGVGRPEAGLLLPVWVLRILGVLRVVGGGHG
jgi:hypothetical protein